MRISDWSSDVCSSDLEVAARIDAARQTSEEDTGTFSVATAFRVIREDALQIRQATGDDETRIGLDERRPLRVELGTAEDGKSVVSGTSVSVRVDLGGRRIIKKKNK